MGDKKVIVRICNVDRRKSMICITPTITNLKVKGQQYFNISVTRIVLEDEGIEVIEDEVVAVCAEVNKTFMLLTDDQVWRPPFVEEYLEIEETGVQQLISTGKEQQAVDQVQTELDNDLLQPLIRKRDITDDNDLEQQSAKRPRQEHSISAQYDEQQTVVTPSTSAGNGTSRTSNLSVTPSSSQTVTLISSGRREIMGSASFLLSNFTIDWELIGKEIKNQMNDCATNDTPLSITTYNRLTSAMVEQVRKVSTKVPFKIFSSLALDAVKRYSILLDCDEKGNVMGDGSASLAEKLRNHNSYLNRFPHPNKRPKSKIAKGKSLAGIKSSYYDSGTEECTKNLLASLKHCTNDNITDNILESTLKFLRYKLDTTPLHKLVQEISMVRCYKFIRYHFMAATDCDPNNFTTNYEENRRRIIKVLNKKCKPKIKSSASDTVIFEYISRILKENIHDLIKEFEEGSTLDDVNVDGPHPTILKFADGDDSYKYYIITDNVIVTHEVYSIVDAMKLVVMIYFIYYIKYPAELSKTLEFLQIFLFKLMTDESRVSSVRKCGGLQKTVLTLIKKISAVVLTDDEESEKEEDTQSE